MSHTDLQQDGWVSRIPERTRPYVLLARLDRPVGVWLLLLPGWWSIALAGGGLAGMTAQDWALMAKFALGAVVMRAAGCVINDLWDRDLDRRVERTKTRPLANGTVTVPQALVFLAALLLAGLSILLSIPSPAALWLGFAVLPLIGAYPLMKRVTWLPQLFLGITFNFGALMGWAAVTGRVDLPALLLYGAGIFWTLGYDTVYAHQDREDDALAGIKSTALKFGAASRKWVAGFYAAGMSLLAAAGASAGEEWSFFAFLALPALHFLWQIMAWDMADPASSLRIFRSNRDFGMLVLTALII